MKICWVFMKIWIIFKSCCSLWHVEKFRKYSNHILKDISMCFSVPILWKYCKNYGLMPVAVQCGAVKAFLQGSSSPSPSPSWHHHHHHHHHHHYCSLYLRNDQKIWITTKIHIFTKGFKHIECGRFLRDHAGFHEHNEPRVVLYKLWHDIINSHKVTKHACTFSCLSLVTQYTTYTITLQ